MQKLVALLAALAVVPFVLAARSAPGPQGSTTILHEPVVIYDLTGSTLTGQLDLNLVVYNDGTVKYSSVSGFLGQQTVDARTVFVGAPVATQFANDLRAAGAWSLQDQNLNVSDVPLATLTVLRGFTDQNAHSFSYWSAQDEYTGVGQVIADFLATHIPPGGGSGTKK